MKDQLQQNNTSESIKNNELKLMNFCASLSGPCITQCSILEDLSEILQDSVDIIRINIDDPDSESDRYKINAVPTLCLLREGKEIKRFIGVQQLDTLLKTIEVHMEKEKYNA
ncbi:MAG: thioredoxin domain-containing protein [Desulfobacteraceae bacterium]